ncbi:Def8 [Symbiodinium natans]|uniref:Def8 protein n=1 Tax=Symbiodinium natans TaxID=878477 RepID=A0A812SXA7_9DINO|nr:Def8 [Symbiodinium natans]
MPSSSEKVSQEEALRAAEFDLLRQLQKAVRTVILTATVSNSCVNCSHSLCLQLFRLIRSCLLAGCRRFRGANPVVDDFLFLLIVPEFTGTFNNDLEFVAHLCVSHSVASFARQLFEDERRVSHFYCDCAIMRDEELHLAFVSSLMALEPVNFHPDSPCLAQQCLRASLDNLRLQPVLWLQQGSGKLEDHVPAARPDKVLPKTDMGALRSKGSLSSVLAGFLAGSKRRPANKTLEAGAQRSSEKDATSTGDSFAAENAKNALTPAAEKKAADGADGSDIVPDTTVEKLEEAALALNETEELVRQLEFEAQGSRGRPDVDLEEAPAKALLSEALTTCSNVLDLEDMATECPVDDEGGFEALTMEGAAQSSILPVELLSSRPWFVGHLAIGAISALPILLMLICSVAISICQEGSDALAFGSAADLGAELAVPCQENVQTCGRLLEIFDDTR